MKKKINIKKFIASITAISMLATSLVGCTTSSASDNASSSQDVDTSKDVSDDTPQEIKNIVCTIFPIYDWLDELINDDLPINLTFLMNNGVDLHNYQPSVNDIIAIQESDLFVYVGGESDIWVDSIIKPNMNTLNLVEVLGDKVVAEEFVEGMQVTEHDHDHDHEEEHDHDHEEEHDHDHEEEHDHDHDDEHDHDHDHEEDHDHDHKEEHDHDHEEEHDHDHEEDHDHDHEEDHDHDHEEEHDHEHLEDGSCCEEEHAHDDEHVWLSLNNAELLVEELATVLSSLDPTNSDKYTTNAFDYSKKLSDLDDNYKKAISTADLDVILVADRFPLRYLVDDYDLDYYAAFSGCSAEAEVSFETIKFLTDKVDELDLTSILIMEDATQDMAQTIINNSSTNNNIDILVFNSMQSVTNSDISKGIKYIDIMEDNLNNVLVKALNK